MNKRVKKEIDKKYKGYRYLVLGMDIGHRCGYIQIPKGHKFFDKHYDDVDVEVHGGLTFSGKIEGCRGEWIGFDCAHMNDARDPSLMTEEYKNLTLRFAALSSGSIKTKEYVEEECIKLIEQVKDVA